MHTHPSSPQALIVVHEQHPGLWERVLWLVSGVGDLLKNWQNIQSPTYLPGAIAISALSEQTNL